MRFWTIVKIMIMNGHRNWQMQYTLQYMCKNMVRIVSLQSLFLQLGYLTGYISRCAWIVTSVNVL